MVAQTRHERRINALVRLIIDLADAHEQLLSAVDGKISAMRSADAEAIRSAMHREHAIVEQIQETEGLRRQLTENIARTFGFQGDPGERIRARDLAARIGGPQAAAIGRAADRLKQTSAQIVRRNHVAQLAAHNVLRHLKFVFASMTLPAGGSGGYAPTGQMSPGTGERILDAVG